MILVLGIFMFILMMVVVINKFSFLFLKLVIICVFLVGFNCLCIKLMCKFGSVVCRVIVVFFVVWYFNIFDFKDGKLDLLVVIIVIEVGVDVFNVSIMIIENFECLGLV